MFLEGVLITVLVIFIVLFARSMTTFLHEVGHAIPALLFTREEVIVYIGSYGDISKSLRLRFGRLYIYFKFAVFNWRLGLCAHKGGVNRWQWLIILLGGPLMSLLLASFFLWLILQITDNELGVGLATMFLLLGIYDFFLNIIPSNSPLPLHDGTLTYNDGYQIKKIFSLGNNLEQYEAIRAQYKKGEKEANLIALKTLADQSKNMIIAEQLIQYLIVEKRFQEAFSYCEKFFQNKKLTAIQYQWLGEIQTGRHQYHDAVRSYDSAIHLTYGNYALLNKKAIALIAMGEYKAAWQEITFSLNINETSNFTGLLLRAYLHQRGRNWDLSFEDLQKAKELQQNHPDLFLYLGNYYEYQGEWKIAYEHFSRAKTLGSDFHGLEMKLEEMKGRM